MTSRPAGAARRLTVLLSLLAALFAVTVVAACGEDEQDSFSAAAAAASTRDADSAKVRYTVEASGSGLPQPVTLTGEGVSSTSEPRMDLTLDFGPLLQQVGAGGDGRTRMLLDGKRLFVDPPAFPGLTLPGGATWVTADIGKVLDAFGIDAAGFGELLRLTPAQQMQALETADSIKKVGEEDIDGAKTTHYRGEVRLSDYLEALPEDRRKAVEKAIAELEKLPGGAGQDFDKPTPTDLWIDEENRLRRMVSDVATPAQNGAPAGRFKMRFDFSDFGTPLDVQAPPSDDVFDATDTLVQGLKSLPMPR